MAGNIAIRITDPNGEPRGWISTSIIETVDESVRYVRYQSVTGMKDGMVHQDSIERLKQWLNAR